MNVDKMQAWGMPTLDYMNAPKTLKDYLKSFLLSCKVDELSPRTIEDYNQKIGAFVRHCTQLKVANPAEVTANHARLFLLSLQEHCNAISLRDYYNCVNRFFDWMVSEDQLGRNPMASMRAPRVPKTVIQPFSL